MKTRKIAWKNSLANTFDSNSRNTKVLSRCDLTSTVKEHLSKVSSQSPKEYSKIFGRAGGTHRIFTDQCVGYDLTIPLHEFIGPVTAQQFSKATKGPISLQIDSPDDDVFAFAKQEEYKAIITYDGHENKNEDLCEVAQKSYNSGEENSPGVIVLPHNKLEALATVVDQQRAIKDYLSRPIKHVLDLR